MTDAGRGADVDLVVAGGGIAGLVVAHDAARAGRSVTLLEAAPVVGGLLRRGELGGIPVDLGAESFATRTTGVADLVADAGLDLRIVAPAPGGARIVAVGDDGPVRAPLPRGTVLGIPADPLAADVVRILGADGARRAAAEQSAAPLDVDAEPSLADLVAERCGPALVQRLVDPLCRSVYSLPASQVRLSRLHPALWREFRARGSLIAAAGAVASPTAAGAAVAGIEGGMWRLPTALRDAAERHGANIRTDASVRTLATTRSGVRVVLDDEVLHARQVVVATGTAAARALLDGPDPDSTRADSASSAVRVVAVLVDSAALDGRPVGSGVIVAADVPSAAKALTHVTAKWPWTTEHGAAARVPAGRHLVRLSARDAHAPGLDTAADVAREITRLTGVALAAADVVAVTSAVWPDAVADAPVSAERRDRLAAAGIHLAGAGVAGTGLASVIPHARALARTLKAPLSAPATRRIP